MTAVRLHYAAMSMSFWALFWVSIRPFFYMFLGTGEQVPLLSVSVMFAGRPHIVSCFSLPPSLHSTMTIPMQISIVCFGLAPGAPAPENKHCSRGPFCTV